MFICGVRVYDLICIYMFFIHWIFLCCFLKTKTVYSHVAYIVSLVHGIPVYVATVSTGGGDVLLTVGVLLTAWIRKTMEYRF